MCKKVTIVLMLLVSAVCFAEGSFYDTILKAENGGTVIKSQPAPVPTPTYVGSPRMHVTCNAPDANLEIFVRKTGQWVSAGTLPKTLDASFNEYVSLRVSAKGYETLTQGISQDVRGMKQVSLELFPIITNPSTTGILAVGGTVKDSKGKFVPSSAKLKVMTRNVNSYNRLKRTSQDVQDTNSIGQNGSYVNTIASLFDGLAATEGDQIYCGVFTANMQKCLGFKTVRLTKKNIELGYVVVDLTVK